MYVPAPHKPLPRRLARFLAWKGADAFASAISVVRGFKVPDDPLQPFAQKLPMLLGLYERSTVREIEDLVRPGMVAIDGGAHVGYMTRLLSRLVGPSGKVLAFEIDDRNLELLRANTKDLKNVEIVPVALGSDDGTATIFSGGGHSARHSITSTKPGLEAKGAVPVRSIASILTERGLERVDFIKLDIEGGEPVVLRSLTEGPVSVVFEVKRYILEAGDESPEKLLAELIDRGFIVRREGGGPIDRTELERPVRTLDKANIVAIKR